jgi:hypothetical protein
MHAKLCFSRAYATILSFPQKIFISLANNVSPAHQGDAQTRETYQNLFKPYRLNDVVPLFGRGVDSLYANFVRAIPPFAHGAVLLSRTLTIAALHSTTVVSALLLSVIDGSISTEPTAVDAISTVILLQQRQEAVEAAFLEDLKALQDENSGIRNEIGALHELIVDCTSELTTQKQKNTLLVEQLEAKRDKMATNQVENLAIQRELQESAATFRKGLRAIAARLERQEETCSDTLVSNSGEEELRANFRGITHMLDTKSSELADLSSTVEGLRDSVDLISEALHTLVKKEILRASDSPETSRLDDSPKSHQSLDSTKVESEESTLAKTELQIEYDDVEPNEWLDL